MNVLEFHNQFNLGYNNILGPGAPGLNTYEISVYLTNAQEEIVRELYSGKINKVGFENTERNRRALNELVENYKTSAIVPSTRNITEESRFYELPNNLMFIVNETIVLKSKDSCLNGKVVVVKPITHDEFTTSYRNPFRKPNKNKAWRLDISKERSLTTVEIISEIDISEYRVRYIKYPNPIIISDLTTDPELVGLGLTINNQTAVAECELNSYLHQEILNRAIELAIVDYRENTLQTQIQTNNRV